MILTTQPFRTDVRLSCGTLVSCWIQESTTVQDILSQVLPHTKVPGRHAIVQFDVTGSGSLRSKHTLMPATRLMRLRDSLSTDGDFAACSLHCVRLADAVSVSFSTPTRMACGIPFERQIFYVSGPMATFSELEQRVRQELCIEDARHVFGVVGTRGDGQETLYPEAGERLADWPGVELTFSMTGDKKHLSNLGPVRAGFLFKESHGRLFRRLQKRWFALKGNTLQYYHHPSDKNFKYISNLQQCTIQYNGYIAHKGMYALTILHPDSEPHSFYSPDRDYLYDWVIEIRNCRLSLSQAITTDMAVLTSLPPSNRSSAVVTDPMDEKGIDEGTLENVTSDDDHDKAPAIPPRVTSSDLPSEEHVKDLACTTERNSLKLQNSQRKSFERINAVESFNNALDEHLNSVKSDVISLLMLEGGDEEALDDGIDCMERQVKILVQEALSVQANGYCGQVVPLVRRLLLLLKSLRECHIHHVEHLTDVLVSECEDVVHLAKRYAFVDGHEELWEAEQEQLILLRKLRRNLRLKGPSSSKTKRRFGSLKTAFSGISVTSLDNLDVYNDEAAAAAATSIPGHYSMSSEEDLDADVDIDIDIDIDVYRLSHEFDDLLA